MPVFFLLGVLLHGQLPVQKPATCLPSFWEMPTALLAPAQTERLWKLIAILLMAAILCCSRGAGAQESKTAQDGTSSAPPVQTDIRVFTSSFKEAVRERSCLKLATLTSFPLRVNYGNRQTRWLWNRTALCHHFSKIFTAETTRTILEQDLPKEMGWRGWMFGNGDIWIRAFSDEAPPTKPSRRYVFQAANVKLKK